MPSPIPSLSDVLLCAPFNGGHGSAVLEDLSNSRLAVTAAGAATQSNNRSKGYSTSLYLSGAGGSYVRINPLCPLLVGVPGYTIEGWFYEETVLGAQDTLFGFHGPSGNLNKLVVSRTMLYGDATNVGTSVSYASPVPLGEWFHIALVRQPALLELYLNGAVIVSLVPAGGNNIVLADRFSIGQEWDTSNTTPTDLWKGNVQDFLVTAGAKYTAPFTPPDRLFGSVSGTVLDRLGAPAQRRITALTRDASRWSRSTLSDPVTGDYEIQNLPMGHLHTVVGFADDAGLDQPDLVHRVEPV